MKSKIDVFSSHAVDNYPVFPALPWVGFLLSHVAWERRCTSSRAAGHFHWLAIEQSAAKRDFHCFISFILALQSDWFRTTLKHWRVLWFVSTSIGHHFCRIIMTVEQLIEIFLMNLYAINYWRFQHWAQENCRSFQWIKHDVETLQPSIYQIGQYNLTLVFSKTIYLLFSSEPQWNIIKHIMELADYFSHIYFS